MAQPLALDSAPAGQAAGWRKGQDLIDALPYHDRLTPEEKAKVDKLIQEEMKNSTQRPAAFLKELPPAYEMKFEGHPILQAEMERVKAGKPMEPLDVVRYRLEKPPLARRNDFAAWKKALDNAHSQLGHQYNRVLNLELLLKFGSKAWRVQNARLDSANARLTEEVAHLRDNIDTVNRERKLQQTAVGQDLQRMEAEWQELVAKNGEIERACRQLEEEIVLTRATMQQQTGAAGDAQQVGDAANGPLVGPTASANDTQTDAASAPPAAEGGNTAEDSPMADAEDVQPA